LKESGSIKEKKKSGRTNWGGRKKRKLSGYQRREGLSKDQTTIYAVKRDKELMVLERRTKGKTMEPYRFLKKTKENQHSGEDTKKAVTREEVKKVAWHMQEDCKKVTKRRQHDARAKSKKNAERRKEFRCNGSWRGS